MRCRTSNYIVCTAKALSARADALVRDTVSTDRQLWRAKLLAAAKLGPFSLRQSTLLDRYRILFPLRRPRETIYVCISTHLSSRGFQLRTTTVLDSALLWVMPEIVSYGSNDVCLKYSLPSVVQRFPWYTHPLRNFSLSIVHYDRSFSLTRVSSLGTVILLQLFEPYLL